MLTQLKKLIRLNLDDLILCCGTVGGLFLLSQIVIGCVMYFGRPDTSILISGILLPIVAGIMGLIVTVSHVGLSFVQALQFGQTRRRALGLALGVSGFETLCSMGLAVLLAWLERLAAPTLWMKLAGASQIVMDALPPSPVPGPGAPPAPDYSGMLFVEEFSLDWWWIPLIVLGCLAAGLIMGAIIQRYGGKGGWFLWAVWMAVCFLPQLLPWKQFTITDWLFPMMGVMALAGLIWSCWSLLHAVVKS